MWGWIIVIVFFFYCLGLDVLNELLGLELSFGFAVISYIAIIAGGIMLLYKAGNKGDEKKLKPCADTLAGYLRGIRQIYEKDKSLIRLINVSADNDGWLHLRVLFDGLGFTDAIWDYQNKDEIAAGDVLPRFVEQEQLKPVRNPDGSKNQAAVRENENIISDFLKTCFQRYVSGAELSQYNISLADFSIYSEKDYEIQMDKDIFGFLEGDGKHTRRHMELFRKMMMRQFPGASISMIYDLPAFKVEFH